MSHLPTERLAALVNEPPSASELGHLASCADCSREREAYLQLSALAGAERDRIGVPLTSWDGVSAALARDERLMAPRSRSWGIAVGRAAAAVLLVACGVAAGRYSATRTMAAAQVQRTDSLAPRDTSVRFSSVDDALKAQAWSQALYQQATAYVAQNDTAVKSGGESPAGMRTRLAALDRVLETTSAALNQAPYDPVINGYYLTTLGQREATLRQLRTSLPAGVGITSY